MDNYVKILDNDEINLRDLFLTLWHRKIYILLFSTLCVVLASVHLQNTERKYLVEFKLKPVGVNQQDATIPGLGGFASMAGIQLPSSSSDDFIIFKELITSAEVSEIIFENKKIIKDIFRSEWNETLNDYSRPPKNKTQSLIKYLKNLLTGNINLNYMPPNPRRLATFIEKNIEINEDKQTGFLRIRSETSKPELILSLMTQATEAGDKIMRQRYVSFSAEPLAFYKEKLRTARSREHREALAELIIKEEQKLMFASQGKYFTAEPYIQPKISLHPTTPKPKLLLLLSLVFGLFISSAVILIQHIKLKEN
jgi:hypothetical protein